MGRHGQGFHNVAESHYGTEAWDDYWSKLEGDGKVIWADAHLTEVGKQQVLQAHEFIATQLSEKLMPAPESYYVSPLYRCLETANLTYAGLKLPHDRPFKPIIKELLREDNGEHTCDRRSSRTFIHRAFPEWRFESGFSEQDLLWRADHRETHAEHDVRTRTFMDELFSSDRSTYVSLTSHSGAIASKLRVLGHRDFPLPTGGMIPLLVKATRKQS
jgi:broad specificity phosphatase PhoE